MIRRGRSQILRGRPHNICDPTSSNSRMLHAAYHSLTVLVIVIPSCYLMTKYASRLTFYIIVKHIDLGTI